MIRIVIAASASLAALAACSTMATDAGAPAGVSPVQATDSYYVSARDAVSRRADERGSQRAKNVILFIGDGMGVSTITAARIYSGQSKGVDGESYQLAMERLPYSAFAKTYAHDSQVADSAPTAAAMTTGVKSYNGSIGVTQKSDLRDCASAKTNYADSLWEIAEEAGLSTGVVSTARFTHATAAATYAKTNQRDWEGDTNVNEAAKAAGCTDIAAQFVAWSHGNGMEVVLSGGRSQFLPNTVADPEYPDRRGGRADGRNLMDEWNAKAPGRATIYDKAGFDAFDWAGAGQVLGLFEPSHMEYDLDRNTQKEPSLAEMTKAAITRLSKDPKGFVLMVEGGRVDHALHASSAIRALSDTKALDEAVAAAIAMTDSTETLIIVTADHSHTLTIQGYPDRGNPILGLVKEGGELRKGRDGKPYTTLSFANGPGSVCKEQPDKTWRCDREDLTNVDTTSNDFLQPSLTPLGSETHSGEDVPIFAGGPGANLISGTMEQNEIFHVMGRALRLVK